MKKLILLSICGLLGCSATSLSAGDNGTCLSAENTLRNFYAAISEQYCDIAGKLRQGYDKKQCQQIKNVTLISIQPQTCTAGQATFLLDVKFQKTNNRTSHFYGSVALANTDQQGWLITGFQSGNTSLAPPVSPLMAACWTSAELNGNKQEKAIHKTAADHSPPAYDTPNAPAPTLTGPINQSIRSVALPADKKVLAITFDLCEQANEKTGYDAEIINLLRASHVKATLFTGGKWMRSHPDRTQQLMADPLFELGNHAWTHGNLRVIRGEELQQQIRWTQVQYEQLRDGLLALACAAPFKAQAAQSIPQLPGVFRFPYGTCSPESLAAVSGQGLAPVQWDVVSGDPAKSQSAQAIVRTIISQAKPGSIIVAHANGRGWNTAKALPKVIDGLRKQGYEFVKVSELLQMGEPVTASSCYEVKPNDNVKYDKLFGKGTE